jgi:hypothetical protein
VADDVDALRVKTVALAHVCLDELMKDLKHGSPTQRNAAISKIAPALLRNLEAHDDESASMKEMHDSFKELMRDVTQLSDSPTLVTAEPDPLPVDATTGLLDHHLDA